MLELLKKADDMFIEGLASGIQNAHGRFQESSTGKKVLIGAAASGITIVAGAVFVEALGIGREVDRLVEGSVDWAHDRARNWKNRLLAVIGIPQEVSQVAQAPSITEQVEALG